MTWMARIPTAHTDLLAHWVINGATFFPSQFTDDGIYVPPGYIAVCGETSVNEVNLAEDWRYGPLRPFCQECMARLNEHDESELTMHPIDRALLTRMAELHTHIGAAVTGLRGNLENGLLSASRLRAIGTAMSETSADILVRAAQLDGRMVYGVDRVIIDAVPPGDGGVHT